jgi:glycosyltransferase
MPLTFSIITAVYNRVETIGDAVNSVQCQTWPQVEHILIDGGSTDGTVEALEAARDKLAVLISEPDHGIYDALNKGFAQASGDIVGLMHSDDFYGDCGVLERVASAFMASGADGVYGDLDYVARDNHRRVIRRWRSGDYHPERLRWGWMPPHPTLFLRRAVIEQWGGFDTSFQIAADYDAILRYLGRGGIELAYLPEVLVKMRVGGESNRTLARVCRKSMEDYRALRGNGLGGFGILFLKNIRKVPQFFSSGV